MKQNQSTGTSVATLDDLRKQKAYVDKLNKEDYDFSLVVAEAFVRGMRDIGYKNNATAIDELIDNAIQANATRVSILFNTIGHSKEPTELAIVDDGHGMEPGMIRASVLWGGTHREDDRKGFGRYGYGLPSSCVSIGLRYSVYSKVEDSDQWYSVTIDIEEIGEGKHAGAKGRPVAPEPKICDVPTWIPDSLKNGKSGSIIIISKIDRLKPKSILKLQPFFLQHFGIIYRNYLRDVKLDVNGVFVEPLDPLFITEGFKAYDENPVFAEPLPPMEIQVKDGDEGNNSGLIKVRFSYMPPPFFNKPDGKKGVRFSVRKEHNGIIVLRKGRQIDIVKPNKIHTWVNYDRNIGLEIDFDPVLDSDFQITTSKQSVDISDRIWDILKQNGFDTAFAELRKKNRKERAKEENPTATQKSATAGVMKDLEKFKQKRMAEPSAEQKKASEENILTEVKKRSSQSGVPADIVLEQIKKEIEEYPYKLEFVEHGDGSFYKVTQRGNQKVLQINMDHKFYTDVYAAPGVTQRIKRSLEVLMFIVGDCELDSSEDRRRFYEIERMLWSRNLNVALDLLSQRTDLDDEIESIEEASVASDSEPTQ